MHSHLHPNVVDLRHSLRYGLHGDQVHHDKLHVPERLVSNRKHQWLWLCERCYGLSDLLASRSRANYELLRGVPDCFHNPDLLQHKDL